MQKPCGRRKCGELGELNEAMQPEPRAKRTVVQGEAEGEQGSSCPFKKVIPDTTQER